MFWRGLLGVIQLSFLPGVLILSNMRLNKSDLTVLSFPVSLLANYVLVVSLRAFGLYSDTSLFIVIALEASAFIWILFSRRSFSRISEPRNGPTAIPIKVEEQVFGKTGHLVMLAFAAIATWWVVNKIFQMTPVPFRWYDDICNWNRWAIDWYNGRLPFHTWEYPQLLPTNWSITYRLINATEIDYFATFVNGLMPIWMFVSLWAMYEDSKNELYLLAVPVSAVFLNFVVGQWIGQGMADVPSAFFGSMMIYVMYLGLSEGVRIKDFCILGTLIASGAALTKQAGCYQVLIFLGTLWYLGRRQKLSAREIIKSAAYSLFGILVLAGSWYIWQHYRFVHGQEFSNVSQVTSLIYEGKTYFGRFLMANQDIINLIWDGFLPPSLIFAVLITATCVFVYYSIRVEITALTSILCTIPFYFIWAIFFCYGHNQRNFGLAVPFLALSFTAGMVKFTSDIFLPSYHQNPRSWKRNSVFVLALVLILGFCRMNEIDTFDSLLKVKIQRLRRETPVVREMYDRYFAGNLKGKVLTNYGCDWCDIFPGTHGNFVTETFPDVSTAEHKIFGGEFKYVMVYDSADSPSIYALGLKTLERAGRLRTEHQEYDEDLDVDGKIYPKLWTLYEIVL